MISKFAIKLTTLILSIMLYILLFSTFSQEINQESLSKNIYSYASPESKLKVEEAFTRVCDPERIEDMLLAGNDEIKSYCSGTSKDFFVTIISKKVNLDKIKGGFEKVEEGLIKEDSLAAKLIRGFKTIWKILSFSIIASTILLFVLLYFLNKGDMKEYISSISDILYELSLWLVIPYLLLKLYLHYGSIDSSVIVNSIFSPGFYNPFSVFFSLLMIIMTMKYTALIFSIGVVLFIITLALKFTRNLL